MLLLPQPIYGNSGHDDSVRSRVRCSVLKLHRGMLMGYRKRWFVILRPITVFLCKSRYWSVYANHELQKTTWLEQVGPGCHIHAVFHEPGIHAIYDTDDTARNMEEAMDAKPLSFTT